MSDDEKGTKQEQDVVSKFQIKMPNFVSNNPRLWFVLVESTFTLHKIVSDEKKFHYVVTNLAEDILLSISDIILDPPLINKYDTLKAAVLKRHTESETTRITKLLSGVAIGDNTPSQYYRELKNLAGASKEVSEELLQRLWSNGLPEPMKSILASTQQTTVQTLLDTADKIHESMLTSNLASEIKYPSQNVLDGFPVALMHEIKLIIRQELDAVRSNELSNSNNRSRSPYRGSQNSFRPSRNSSRGSSPHPNNTGRRNWYCYYHHLFGAKARKCVGKCFFANNQNKEKN